MPLPARPGPVIAPLQGRSRESYERLLRAAGELLEHGDFETVRVQDIAARAGLTVGAFYARFRSKEALLQHAEELFAASWDELFSSWKAEEVEGGTLETAVRGLVHRLIQAYQSHRGFLRALILRSQVDPQLRDRLGELGSRTVGDAVQALLRHRGEIAHPRPELAVEFGAHLVRSLLRDHMALGSFPSAPPEDEVEHELVHAYLAYLRYPHPE